jgi:hypothetical protein
VQWAFGVGLLEDDGAALGCPLRNRVGVLVGLLDVLGSIVWRIDCSFDGLFDATTEGKLLPSALGTDDCDTLGIPDGSMDAATVGGEVGFSVTLGTSEGIIEGLDETEGDTVGRGEGLWVILGTSDGIIEGLDEMEGDTVGSEEGCWLGTPEAVTEGLDDTEGDKDGFNVGDFEGIFVGYGVGGAGAAVGNAVGDVQTLLNGLQDVLSPSMTIAPLQSSGSMLSHPSLF